MTAEQVRARVLAEWRGLPEVPFTRHTAKAVGGIVTKWMAELGLDERLREEEITKAWAEIVGAFVAKHSAPHRLEKGVLTVRVLQPTVHYELDRVFKPRLLEKLKARFGASKIRELKFRLG
jgi:predicted nucleic acid-binding Zn ribbon protein